MYLVAWASVNAPKNQVLSQTGRDVLRTFGVEVKILENRFAETKKGVRNIGPFCGSWLSSGV